MTLLTTTIQTTIHRAHPARTLAVSEPGLRRVVMLGGTRGDVTRAVKNYSYCNNTVVSDDTGGSWREEGRYQVEVARLGHTAVAITRDVC